MLVIIILHVCHSSRIHGIIRQFSYISRNLDPVVELPINSPKLLYILVLAQLDETIFIEGSAKLSPRMVVDDPRARKRRPLNIDSVRAAYAMPKPSVFRHDECVFDRSVPYGVFAPLQRARYDLRVVRIESVIVSQIVRNAASVVLDVVPDNAGVGCQQLKLLGRWYPSIRRHSSTIARRSSNGGRRANR